MLVISATSTAPLRKLTVQAIHDKKVVEIVAEEPERKTEKHRIFSRLHLFLVQDHQKQRVFRTKGARRTFEI